MRKFLKPFFSKKMFGILFLLLQLVLLILPAAGIYESNIYLDAGVNLIAVFVIIFEINRETDAGFKLIWIAIIAVVPVFGIFLYILNNIILCYLNNKRIRLLTQLVTITINLIIKTTNITIPTHINIHIDVE